MPINTYPCERCAIEVIVSFPNLFFFHFFLFIFLIRNKPLFLKVLFQHAVPGL
jgi:hypothetical protein